MIDVPPFYSTPLLPMANVKNLKSSDNEQTKRPVGWQWSSVVHSSPLGMTVKLTCSIACFSSSLLTCPVYLLIKKQINAPVELCPTKVLWLCVQKTPNINVRTQTLPGPQQSKDYERTSDANYNILSSLSVFVCSATNTYRCKWTQGTGNKKKYINFYITQTGKKHRI